MQGPEQVPGRTLSLRGVKLRNGARRACRWHSEQLYCCSHEYPTLKHRACKAETENVVHQASRLAVRAQLLEPRTCDKIEALWQRRSQFAWSFFWSVSACYSRLFLCSFLSCNVGEHARQLSFARLLLWLLQSSSLCQSIKQSIYNCRHFLGLGLNVCHLLAIGNHYWHLV